MFQGGSQGQSILGMISRGFGQVNMLEVQDTLIYFRPISFCVLYPGRSPNLVNDTTCWNGTKMITGFKNLSYDERLKRSNMLPLQRRVRLRGDLSETFKMLTGNESVDIALLVLASNDRKRGYSMKLFKPRACIRLSQNYSCRRMIIDDGNNQP